MGRVENRSPKSAAPQANPKQKAGYWHETRRPLACLLFLLPLLGFYEAGVLWVGGNAAHLVRNGADNWMRWVLVQLGFEQLYVLPLLVLTYFLLWQLWSGHPWSISAPTLVGMFAESALFALGLVALSQLQEHVYHGWVDGGAEFARACSAGTAGDTRATLALLIAFFGAGVYEEVLFRLGMVPACYGLLRLFALPRPAAAVSAILITSVLFSWAHYIGPYGDAFDPFSFFFRVSAGVVFATLFVLRGFGIAVGAHALYDIVVGLL